MKLVQPNKVHLLRGPNECLVLSNTNNKNKSSSSSSSSSRSKKKLIGMNETTIMQQPLWNECYQKYGKQYGQIIGETLAKIFALLPIIIIVDENIACVHSGIPLSSSTTTSNKNLEQHFYSSSSSSKRQHNINNDIPVTKRDDDDDYMDQITKQASFI